jgi:hypothetical protein
MKKVLPVAVLAALAGVNGAQAVHVNPDGLGQVLVYPFYTTNAGQDTLIQLVNTTDEYKAVKVRILESMNSQEVLDFNVYLSPFDHWSAQISADGEGAAISTGDTSCTVPTAVSEGQTIPFRTTLFDGSGDNPEDSVSGLDRTKEGYIEVIEMGVIVDSDDGVADAIKHISGIPGGGPIAADGSNPNCDFLNARWASGGAWDELANNGISLPTGGLYGYGILIDVPGATDATYDAVALDNWNGETPRHSAPGDLAPNIGSGQTQYEIFDGGDLVEGFAEDGTDAVSAVLMASAISNDYVMEPSVGAGTDWVVTFPTKRFYVNNLVSADAPFTDIWDSESSTACEEFSIRYWDREEGEPTDPPLLNDFSPLPPAGENPEFSFCWEANVLTFNGQKEGFADFADVLGSFEAGRSGASFGFADGFVNGWARINFEGSGRTLTTFDHQFSGLPAVGFAVQRYINQSATADGVNNRYAGSSVHKVDRVIVALPE